MERIMSVEDKIRRAEEIYARRREINTRKSSTVKKNKKNKKNFKLLKKLGIQILVCLLIYLSLYVIQNNNYIFSKEFIDKTNEILSYDINFQKIYQDIKNYITNINKKNDDGAIGGQREETIEQNVNENETNNQEVIEEKNNEAENQQKSDVEKIKATTTFIKPIEGTISSKYGQREPTTSTVPKNHTGIDIAAEVGTKIKSSTQGEVVLASEEGDYGKHLKIQIGEISVIYAHCNNLYVKLGDKIEQGQEIAEVGTTGNSTGPHLHFEIRISERTVNPEQIVQF